MPFPLRATAPQFSSEVPPAGNHPAVLVALIDLGTHETSFTDQKTGNKKETNRHEVYLIWELVDQLMAGSKFNHVIGKVFTVSLAETAALRKMVEAWFGKKFKPDQEFDLEKLIGVPGMANIVHAESRSSPGKFYANISAIAAVPGKMKVEKPKRTPFVYQLGHGPYKGPDWIPFIYGEKVEDKIAACLENRRGAPQPNGQQPAAPAEDVPESPFDNKTDIPF